MEDKILRLTEKMEKMLEKKLILFKNMNYVDIYWG